MVSIDMRNVRLISNHKSSVSGREIKAGTVGKILAVRTINNVTEYLVKWQGVSWPISMYEREVVLIQ